MPVLLSDISAATATYLRDDVDVTIGRITGNLEPGEEGTMTVRWTNPTAPTGVRLTDVVLHLRVTPGDVARYKVPSPTVLQPRAVQDIGSPSLTTGDLVTEMFLFLPPPGVSPSLDRFDSTLDVGETAELELAFEATGRGSASFTAHVHAAVALEDLFPRGAGPDGTRSVTVR